MAIGRRELIAILGGAPFAWPLVAHSQRASMPVIGFLNSGSQGERGEHLAKFRDGLAEVG